MKQTLLLLIVLLALLNSCMSSVEIFIIKDSIKNKIEKIDTLTILELASSDYNFRPSIRIKANIPSIANSEFKNEIKDIFSKENKKVLPFPIQLEECQKTANIIRKHLNNIYDIKLSNEDKTNMQDAAKAIGTRYCIVLENIAMKNTNANSPQSTFSIGASMQIWDLEKAELIFRGRNRVVGINQMEEDLKVVIKDKFRNLFSELLNTLP